jgi:hypothetical protein
MTESEPQLVSDFNAPLKGGRKTKKHGKRHGNASLRAWVTFVKKVAKEEKLSYRDAMMRAKARKDKGEKWMKGGENTPMEEGDMMEGVTSTPAGMEIKNAEDMVMEDAMKSENFKEGGRRRRRSGRKTHRKKSHKKRRGSRRR